jgi:hypothetical protein
MARSSCCERSLEKRWSFLQRCELSVDDQESGLHERRLLGQLLDRNPAVAQDALFSIDKGDGAPTGTGVPIAAIEGAQTGLVAKFADINRPLARTPFNQGQRGSSSIPAEFSICIHRLVSPVLVRER